MSCPTFEQLPSLPPGKAGWPWTDEPLPLPKIPKGAQWPKISIITPSFNQGQYLEETIRSVLLQRYPNLEYLVLDGGSTDDSKTILQMYASHLTYWVSEMDNGQAHAINKGIALASGDLVGWINSDDTLLPHALFQVAVAYLSNPRSILLGDVINLDEIYHLKWRIRQRNVSFKTMSIPGRYNVYWQQQGLFFPRSLFMQVGPMKENLRYLFDYDWICRAMQMAPVYYLQVPISQYRLHHSSKTVQETHLWAEEKLVISKQFWYELNERDRKFARASLDLSIAEDFLHLISRNQQKAFHFLQSAVARDWRILFLSKFWQAIFMIVLPDRSFLLLRRLRTFLDFSGLSRNKATLTKTSDKR